MIHHRFLRSRSSDPRAAIHRRIPKKVRRMTTSIYLIAGIVAGLLLTYLVVALLKPEWFA